MLKLGMLTSTLPYGTIGLAAFGDPEGNFWLPKGRLIKDLWNLNALISAHDMAQSR